MNGNSHVASSHLQQPSHDQLTSHSIPNAKKLYDDVNINSHQDHNTSTATSSGTFAGNKMRNNVGHKASQMRRIQLSTASKRCKSTDNNPKAINNTHQEKAATTGTDDDDADRSCQINVGDDMTSANNSTSQSTASPTLVRVKTWYTESSYGVLVPTALNLQEQHRYIP